MASSARLSWPMGPPPARSRHRASISPASGRQTAWARRPAAVTRTTDVPDTRSPGPPSVGGSTRRYPHRRSPANESLVVPARSWRRSTRTPSGSTYWRTLAHITWDTSQGRPAGPPDDRPAPVRWGIRCSNSLSNSTEGHEYLREQYREGEPGRHGGSQPIRPSSSATSRRGATARKPSSQISPTSSHPTPRSSRMPTQPAVAHVRRSEEVLGCGPGEHLLHTRAGGTPQVRKRAIVMPVDPGVDEGLPVPHEEGGGPVAQPFGDVGEGQADGPDPRQGRRRGPLRVAHAKTTVRWPLSNTRSARCHRSPRARTERSTSRPMRRSSSTVSAWSMRAVSCSMIGPASSSAVT